MIHTSALERAVPFVSPYGEVKIWLHLLQYRLVLTPFMASVLYNLRINSRLASAI